MALTRGYFMETFLWNPRFEIGGSDPGRLNKVLGIVAELSGVCTARRR
jgi:hypothetical protein